MMTDLRAAAHQALEAVEQTRRLMPDSYYHERLHKAAATLRAALAEPVPAFPEGYEPHELPADYTGKLWIEGQVRRLYDAAMVVDRVHGVSE